MTQDIGAEIIKTAHYLNEIYPINYLEAINYAEECYSMFYDFKKSHLKIILSDLDKKMAGMK